jgi:hypothetical protein
MKKEVEVNLNVKEVMVKVPITFGIKDDVEVVLITFAIKEEAKSLKKWNNSNST